MLSIDSESQKPLSRQIEEPSGLRERIIQRMNDLVSTYQDNLSKQIVKIIFYHVWAYSSKTEKSVIDYNDILELARILKIKDEIELQLQYCNWVFLKSVNKRNKLLTPENSDFKTMNTAFFSVVGGSNQVELSRLNTLLEKGELKLTDLHNFITTILIHIVPNDWDLCPDSSGMVAFSSHYKLTTLNYIED